MVLDIMNMNLKNNNRWFNHCVINCGAINPADQSSSMINRFAISQCMSNIEDELRIDN
jgi:hypothetical protein